MALQRAARDGEGVPARPRTTLPSLFVAPVDVRSDPEAVTFLRRNQAVAATLDASTIAIDPSHRGSTSVLSHEFAHIAQLRGGLTASRDASERAAVDYARGARTDVGGAAAPPLFQLEAEAEARAAAEVRDLPKLGAPAANVPTNIDVGAEGTKIDLGPRNMFHATVSAAGENGQIESATDFTFHMDPEQRYGSRYIAPAAGPPVGTIVDIEGRGRPGALAPVEPVPLYPVILKYTRLLRLGDRDGRTCDVTVTSTVQFSYATWQAATAGRTASLETLQALAGDTAFTGIVLSGAGLVQKYDVMITSEARSIGAGIAEAEAKLGSSHALEDAAGLPMTFIVPNETAGGQFSTLEAVLARLDEKELERRAKLRVVEFSGGDPDEDLPPWARGVLSTLEKAILGIAAVFTVAAVISALPFAIGFGAAVLWIGATLLAYSFVSSLIERIREAARVGVRNPLLILGVAVLDTIGAGSFIQSITDRSLLSGRELNRTEEERWEAGSAGLLTLIMTVFGVRSAARKYRGRPPEPAPDVATAPKPPAARAPELQLPEAGAFDPVTARLREITLRGGPLPQETRAVGAAVIEVEGYSGPREVRAISAAATDPLGADAPIPHATVPTTRTLPGARNIGGRSGDFPGSHINDVEQKLLEQVASHLQQLPPDAQGTVHLFTVRSRAGGTIIEPLPACASCTNAAFHFRSNHPGITVVFHSPSRPTATIDLSP
jgi:hypothetical protein